ncbi:hypothetical protein Q8A73_023263 [Channa argus]|nr:hypothetical protein Q8A73_023263 [Channa argus]
MNGGSEEEGRELRRWRCYRAFISPPHSHMSPMGVKSYYETEEGLDDSAQIDLIVDRCKMDGASKVWTCDSSTVWTWAWFVPEQSSQITYISLFLGAWQLADRGAGGVLVELSGASLVFVGPSYTPTTQHNTTQPLSSAQLGCMQLHQMRGSAGCEMAVVIAPRPRALQPIHSPVSSLIELVEIGDDPTVTDPPHPAPPHTSTFGLSEALRFPPGVKLSPGSSTDMWTRQLHPITSNNDLGDREMRGEEVIRLSAADRLAEQEAWEQAQGDCTCDHAGAAQPVLHYWLVTILTPRFNGGEEQHACEMQDEGAATKPNVLQDTSCIVNTETAFSLTFH